MIKLKRSLTLLFFIPLLIACPKNLNKQQTQAAIKDTVANEETEVQERVKESTNNFTELDPKKVVDNFVKPCTSCDAKEQQGQIPTPKTMPKPKKVATKTTGLGSDPGYSVSLKNYPRPSKGCNPASKVSISEANKLMASQRITTKGATNVEKKVLGATIKWVQHLNGGPLKTGMGPRTSYGTYQFRYVNRNGSAQRADHIRIGRNSARGHKHYGNSVAQHAHEWAHLIGNQGAYAAYARYMNKGGYGKKDYCMVSNYADNTRGEQFAEVFTAFVTEPRILLVNKRTPKNCKKAFEFLKGWFGRGDRVNECL